MIFIYILSKILYIKTKLCDEVSNEILQTCLFNKNFQFNGWIDEVQCSHEVIKRNNALFGLRKNEKKGVS